VTTHDANCVRVIGGDALPASPAAQSAAVRRLCATDGV
jgi:hypothetical protein